MRDIFFLSVLGPVLALAAAEPHRVTGVVLTTAQTVTPVKHTKIVIVGVGNTMTSDSGEFQLPLPADGFAPGTPVTVEVPDWFLYDPWQGLGILPAPQFPMRVIVERPGSASLRSHKALRHVMERYFSNLYWSNSQSFDAYLISQAALLGFPVEVVRSDLSVWMKHPEGDYERGLVALYQNDDSQAVGFLKQSIAKGSKAQDLFPQYMALALAEYRAGNYSGANSALNDAQALRPLDADVGRGLAIVTAAKGTASPGVWNQRRDLQTVAYTEMKSMWDRMVGAVLHLAGGPPTVTRGIKIRGWIGWIAGALGLILVAGELRGGLSRLMRSIRTKLFK